MARLGWWVAGGPYAGKTTVAKLLKAAFADDAGKPRDDTPPVVETDEERKRFKGFRPELWRAWKLDHPLHKEWQRQTTAMRQQIFLPAFESGGIVLDHDVPKGIPFGRVLFLRPSDARLAEKQAADLASRGEDAVPRVQAARHYWTKDSAKQFAERAHKVFTKATECVDFILNDYQQHKEAQTAMANENMFWGVIKDGSKTYAVVGPSGAVEMARKALGTVANVEQKNDIAPLPIAPLQGEPAAKAGTQNEEHKPEDVDAGGQSVDAARGLLKKDKVAGDKNNASRWMTVRAPAK